MADGIPAVVHRDGSGPDSTQEFLKLLENPFGTAIQASSIWAALGSSIGITLGIAFTFSLLRPYNRVVYAPKLKHADDKHAPPPIGKGIFAWVSPIWKTTEQDLIHLIGMDATVFLRFTRMCRNMLLMLTVIGCVVLIPVNWTSADPRITTWLTRITPQNNIAAGSGSQWANVTAAWLFNIIVCGFLWWNYRKILQLRRQYFDSQEYRQSLHARTLMLYDIPKQYSSDEGIARIIDEVVPQSSFSRTAIARDVKILPDLIQQHNDTVRQLEKVLAIYLKDPQNLPSARPVCYPSKKDRSQGAYPKGQKVDAIEYLTDRIKSLELEIKEVRQSVDKRITMPYGFASYAEISEAHSIAYTLKKKPAHGAKIQLATRPNDIIWDNMPLSAATRSRRRWWNNMWIAILTLLWVAPNAMIAIFLVNLANLGKVWPAFQTSLANNQSFWAIVQGIASPAVTSIIYLLLPIMFRRLSVRAGDQSKTGRERHVTAKLYSFFVFNNLVVFSIFGGMWTFTATVINSTGQGTDAWNAISNAHFGATVFVSMCQISPFWVTWLLQRQLGAATDLAQLWPLIYSFFMRKFSSPTPRELIELTAPQSFDYASYYNYFLYYTTVTLCYAFIQPLVLPAAALYFFIDVHLKKYLLMYVFVTKTESGGMFWRLLVNRVLFGLFISNLVVFLVTWVRGDGTHIQAFAVAPLPLLLLGFKFFCSRVFDDKIYYFATTHVSRSHAELGMNVKQESLRSDRLAAKFGHPALYKPLITPMVHAKAQHKLAGIYRGRLSDGREVGSGDLASVSGYSDTYVLENMATGKPGQVSSMPGFELVPESRLDFEFYRNRDEFAAEHGGGEIFGTASDVASELGRSGTPGSARGGSEGGSRPGTPVGGMGWNGGRRVGSPSRDASGGTTYSRGHNGPVKSLTTYPAPPAFAPLAPPLDGPLRTQSPLYTQTNDSQTKLMAMSSTEDPYNLSITPSSSTSTDRAGPAHGNSRVSGLLGGGSPEYGGVPQAEPELPGSAAQASDPTQYDYFRGNRRNNRNTIGPGGATRSGNGARGDI